MKTDKTMETYEEAQDRRTMNWLMNPRGKTCKTCQWASFEKGDDIHTCGHHIQNFSVKSSCGSWTHPKDSYLVQSKKDAIKRLKQRNHETSEECKAEIDQLVEETKTEKK